jgi:hypothetical protein
MTARLSRAFTGRGLQSSRNTWCSRRWAEQAKGSEGDIAGSRDNRVYVGDVDTVRIEADLDANIMWAYCGRDGQLRIGSLKKWRP